jgi:hypothetical protein
MPTPAPQERITEDQVVEFVELVDRYTLQDSRTYAPPEEEAFDDRLAKYRKNGLTIGVRSLVSQKPELREVEGVPVVYRREQHLVSVRHPITVTKGARLVRMEEFVVGNSQSLKFVPSHFERTILLSPVFQGELTPEEKEHRRQEHKDAARFAKSIGQTAFTQTHFREVKGLLWPLTPADQVPVDAP